MARCTADNLLTGAAGHSWREMTSILTAALQCESDSQRAAVIDRFCQGDATLKERLLERLLPNE